MIPYLTCIKIRVELMLLYYKANENHTINVLVVVGILNGDRFIFTGSAQSSSRGLYFAQY